MLDKTRLFLDRLFAGSADGQAEAPDSGIRLAVAALLVEVLKADYDASDEERDQVLTSIGNLFELDQVERTDLFEFANRVAERAHDLHQFTARINDAFSAEQKLRLLEQLWRVARADDLVHKYEEHLIRRVADLLHIPHSGFITAKLRSERPV